MATQQKTPIETPIPTGADNQAGKPRMPCSNSILPLAGRNAKAGRNDSPRLPAREREAVWTRPQG
jgi:hypothetical protein